MKNTFAIKKMKLKYKYILLVIIVLQISCKYDNDKKNTSIDVENAVATKKYSIEKLSKYASSIKYVPLETSDSILINRISDIQYENGNIIINDNDEKVYRFNSSVKFCNMIGKRGNGPGEFISVNSMDISNNGNYCYILDVKPRILKYKLDGTFIQIIPLTCPEKHYIKSIKELSSDNFICDLISGGEIEYSFTINNDSLDVKKTKKSYDSLIKDNGPSSAGIEYGILLKSNQNIHHYKPITDTIWSIDKELNISPFFTFNYGKYKMPHESSKIYGINNIADQYIRLLSIRESSKYLFINFDFGKYSPEPISMIINKNGKKREIKFTNVYAIFDKESKNITLMKRPAKDESGFLNDYEGEVSFWPYYISRSNEMIMQYSSQLFIEKYINTSNKLKSITKNIKEDDNPIIIIAKLNE